MILQNWWYTTLLNTKVDFQPPLRGRLAADVAVVGGGIAGLHAALHLVRAGRKVVLLERNICGGSSTGKSAGFLTPDSELELSQLVRRYGVENARKVWGIAEQGVKLIVDTIRTFNISCDLQPQDSLYVGIGASGAKAVAEEMESRAKVGLAATHYDQKSLPGINAGRGYTAAVRYGGTYGINAMLYAQELKETLLGLGVKIFESAEVTAINDHTITTHLGSVTADHIIVCIDKMPRDLHPIAEEVYHAQTFLSITEPLDDHDIDGLFPGPDKNLMCWDSFLIYSYYRLTGDRRLLLGGGSAVTTFLPKDITVANVINSVIADFKNRFPALAHIMFIQYWPGRIDTTKDLIPIVDFDPVQPHLQFVLGCVGLPWAAFCGYYAARRLLEPSFCHEYCNYLKIARRYFIPRWLQGVIGKTATFSINNAYSKYWQSDANGGHPNQHDAAPAMDKKTAMMKKT